MTRFLTFLDPNDGVPPNDGIGFIVAFALLAAISVIAMSQAVYGTRRPIYKKHTIVFLFPLACLAMSIENATLAVDAAGSWRIPQWWKDIVYALEATVAPTLLVSTFDVTYIIHKTRHLSFCGVYDGQTQRHRPGRTMAVKLLLRTLAVTLLVLGLLVNFNVFQPTSPYAGRVGWSFVVEQPFTDAMVSVIMGLVPLSVSALCCLRFSFVLWKYGTTCSMVVHSSPLNLWSLPFFGALALAASLWFGARLYAVMSNAGIFLFTESICCILLEVNKDLQAASELNHFLQAFDEMKQEEEKHKQEFDEEEKQEVDESSNNEKEEENEAETVP